SHTLRFSKQAAEDLDSIIEYTRSDFGEGQVELYKRLVRDAFAALVADPLAPPAKHRPELHPDARVYHLARRGRPARHFLVCRVVDCYVEIARILHDSMDIRQHLPEGFGVG